MKKTIITMMPYVILKQVKLTKFTGSDMSFFPGVNLSKSEKVPTPTIAISKIRAANNLFCCFLSANFTNPTRDAQVISSVKTNAPAHAQAITILIKS